MKLNKIIVAVTASVVALAMAGCGGATGASTSAGETAAMASTEGFTVEGPMTTASEAMTGSEGYTSKDRTINLEYEGAYTETTGMGYSLLIKPTDEENGVYVTVGFMDEEEQIYYIWDIFGEIEDYEINYKDAVCTRMIPDQQSETGVLEETVYMDGKGTLTIGKDGSIIWTDAKVNNGEELTFMWDQGLNDLLQEQSSIGMN